MNTDAFTSRTTNRPEAGLTTGTRTTTHHTPFSTLLRVETRKLHDTRTSIIMTVALSAVSIALVVGRALFAGPAELSTLANTAALALSVLLPVLGILTVTGEWSHRTALTTFTLEPRRGRVLAAKCLPVLGASVAACLLALLVAVPMTAVSAAVRGVPATWGLELGPLLGWIATIVLSTAEGLALGMLLLNAPAAIVIYLVSPMLWGFVSQLGATGQLLAEWLDLNTATNALMDGNMGGGDVPQLAVTIMVWVVIPMGVGVLRVLRKDVQ
ncbi:ABC transporter permease subunit [Nonomuraea gerenzanensis]|uniref:Uncharacterized protein n=1 Tax=Nonomuraea gerenzanensis TaxID=93944 RepID=A0A1M4EF67_9ACTN|nr:ABC transporter permease subunit [Nonomuraea gerenzanensis]UBU09048.1 ABC transporter permease subunit [Nonomuraea gerenzanensis]SBO97432.1 hypothetical protein BN4615_P6948 [Nonomuraea gerenzanensis]